MTKLFVRFLLVMGVAVLLVACGSDDEGDDSDNGVVDIEENEADDSGEADEDIILSFRDDSYRVTYVPEGWSYLENVGFNDGEAGMNFVTGALPTEETLEGVAADRSWVEPYEEKEIRGETIYFGVKENFEETEMIRLADGRMLIATVDKLISDDPSIYVDTVAEILASLERVE